MPEVQPYLKIRVDLVRGLLLQLDNLCDGIDTVVGFDRNTMPSKYLEMVKKAALVRQREALEAILTLCEGGHAAFSACLLRPAFEEMLWLKYLAKNDKQAADLVYNLSIRSVGRSLQAQQAYLNEEIMHLFGFSKRFVDWIISLGQNASIELKKIGAELAWRNGAEEPTVAKLAQEVGMKDDYNFLYEGTSRFVHFSPHELGRRAWGDNKKLTVNSRQFEAHWGRFSPLLGVSYLRVVIVVRPTSRISIGNTGSRSAARRDENFGTGSLSRTNHNTRRIELEIGWASDITPCAYLAPSARQTPAADAASHTLGISGREQCRHIELEAVDALAD